jgi:hypothetical protein
MNTSFWMRPNYHEEGLVHHFLVSWRTFLKLLPAWEGMSLEGRKLFLEKVHPHLNVDPALFGDYLSELLNTGLVELSPKKQWVKVTSQTVLFHRTMVGMTISKIHSNPDKHAAWRYLNNHYSPAELEKLLHYRSHHEKENAFLKITTISWLERFLMAEDYQTSEGLHGTDSISYPLIASQEIFATMKRIIRLLMACPEVIPFSSLPRGEKATDDEVLADALDACRYALLFPELRSADLMPVIGIWPAISQHLHRQKPKAPQPGQATECFFLYNRLVEEYGYTGSEPTVRRYVRFAKLALGIDAPCAFIPCDPEAGYEGEADWGTATAMPVDKDAYRAYSRRTIIIAGGVDNDAEEQDQHNHGPGSYRICEALRIETENDGFGGLYTVCSESEAGS